jgi:hypothetical protein
MGQIPDPKTSSKYNKASYNMFNLKEGTLVSLNSSLQRLCCTVVSPLLHGRMKTVEEHDYWLGSYIN